LFVEGQVSIDVVDQQHELTVQMKRTQKICLTETLKYYWPLLGSRKGEAPHSHIDRDSVKRALPAGKYDFGICALFIQNTGTNPQIQFLS
jgi:hypothetical protein